MPEHDHRDSAHRPDPAPIRVTRTAAVGTNLWHTVDHMIGEFDCLNPRQKYKSLCLYDSRLAENATLVLISLHILDRCFYARFSYGPIYILECPAAVSVLSTLSNVTLNEFRRGIMALHICQLIYRFTAALRFCLPDTSVKQLRINSWGHDLASSVLPTREHLHVEHSLMEILDAHRTTYMSAVETLRLPMTDRRAMELNTINSRLQIKLVQ